MGGREGARNRTKGRRGAAASALSPLDRSSSLSFPSVPVPLRWVSGCPALAPEEESSSGGDLSGGKDKRGRKLRPVLLLSCGWVDFRQQWKRRKGGSQIAAARKEKGPPPPPPPPPCTTHSLALHMEGERREVEPLLLLFFAQPPPPGGILHTEQQSRAEGPLNVLPCVAGPGGGV